METKKNGFASGIGVVLSAAGSAVGWLIGPRRAMEEMEDGATRLGVLKKIFPVMVRFVTPALILVVEVGGVISKIRAGQWFVVVAAYLRAPTSSFSKSKRPARMLTRPSEVKREPTAPFSFSALHKSTFCKPQG